jgi:hypothetical protein
VESKRISKEWINHRVLVALRNEIGDTYSILGRLRAANEEEIRVELQASGRTRTYAWGSVVEVHSLGTKLPPSSGV